MASLFGLGFLKGAATGLSDSIDKRQDFEREQRKQELLTKLRLQTEKEVADYNELIRSKRADDKQSGFDESTGKYIIRNDMGQQIGERDATTNELQAIADERNKTQQETRYRDAQIRNLDEDNRRADANLAINRMNADTARMNATTTRKGLDSQGGDERNQVGSFNVGAEIIRANDKVAQDLISKGVPAEEVSRLAARAAANAKARKQDFNAAQQYFLEGARLLRSAVKEADPADPSSKRSYSDQVGVDAINKYRAGKGLEGYK